MHKNCGINRNNHKSNRKTMPTIFFKCGIFNPKIQPRKGFQILCTWNQREESDGKCFFFQWMYLTYLVLNQEGLGERRDVVRPMMSNSKLKNSLLPNLKFYIPNNLREIIFIPIYAII